MGQIARVMSDGLRNLVSGLGGQNDKAQGSTYVLKIPTRMEIDACYRGTWLGRKIHDIPALDMTREWRAWQADDDQIEAIELVEKNLAVRARVRRALVMARLYGGSAIIMGLPGNPTSAAPEKIGKGQLRYLHVVHRHQLSLAQQERDLTNPNFGKPSMLSLDGGVDGKSGAVQIHPSRVVAFVGNQLPDGATGAISEDWFWGDPVLVSVFDALTTHDTGTAAIAALLNEAKVDVVHVPGFMDNLTSDQYERTLIERFTIAGMLKSITNTLVLDGGDGTENSGERWEARQMNWAGLPEMQRTLFQLVSGAADIPATRLIGQSPTGMNATGEGDTRNYYDMLASLQNSDLTPTIAGLDEYLIMTALGPRDPAIFYEWNPLWQLSPTEKATRDKTVADTANTYATMGVVPDDAFAVAVQNRLIEDGVFPGLEAAIEEADKVARLEQDEPEPGAVDPATGLPIAQPGQPAIPAPANQNDPNANPGTGKRPAIGAGRGKSTMTLSGNSKRRAANDRARARIRDAAVPMDSALLLTNVVDYNRNHEQSGENGGRFTSAPGGAAPAGVDAARWDGSLTKAQRENLDGPDEAMAEFKKIDGQFTASAELTDDELAAVRDYGEDSYTFINDDLRGGNVDADTVGPIDAAIGKERTVADMIVYRGLTGYATEADDVPVGAVVTDKGYSSMSANQRSAARYAFFATEQDNDGVLLEVKLPKGSTALNMHPGRATYSHEREVILPRGSQFKITSKPRDVDMITLNGEPFTAKVVTAELVK